MDIKSASLLGKLECTVFSILIWLDFKGVCLLPFLWLSYTFCLFNICNMVKNQTTHFIFELFKQQFLWDFWKIINAVKNVIMVCYGLFLPDPSSMGQKWEQHPLIILSVKLKVGLHWFNVESNSVPDWTCQTCPYPPGKNEGHQAAFMVGRTKAAMAKSMS